MSSKLREAREAAGYTIEYVANRLNIRKQYLLALEEENYEEIPGQVYVEGYTKMYCDFLGINSSEEKNEKHITKILTDEIKSEAQTEHNKYINYIYFCSIILLLLVIVSYNVLVSEA